MRVCNYEVHDTGYTVEVVDTNTGRIIHEYAAGNNPLESSPESALPAGEGLDRETLEQYAKQTAEEIAEEYNAVMGDDND